MEIFIVYGLVVVFFVLLIPVIYLLMKDPIQNMGPEEVSTTVAVKRSPSEKIAYGVLAALFTLLLALTVLIHRTKS